MERYKAPAPEDIEKAEEMMTLEQKIMSRKRHGEVTKSKFPIEFKLETDEPLKDLKNDSLGCDLATVYLDNFSRKITSFSGESYHARNNVDDLKKYYTDEGIERVWHTVYDHNFMSWRPEEQEQELREQLEPYFKDKIVLELGCGKNGDGYIIADYLKAKGYIGSEMLFPKSAEGRMALLDTETPFYIVPGDFSKYLDFLKNKNQKVGVLLMVGIDMHSYQGQIPLEGLSGLLSDCLDDNGILITDSAYDLQKNFEEVQKIECLGGRTMLICKKIIK